MVWKLCIVLIWLALPISAGLMLREDRARYEAEGQRQLEASKAWEVHLRDFERQSLRLGKQIERFSSRSDRDAWERQWQDIERQRVADEQSLGVLKYSHYPATEASLNRAVDLYTSQRRAYQNAARAQDNYIAATESLDLILEDIRDLEAVARYWQFQGRFGVYLNLQDELARRESIYHERRGARTSLAAKVRDLLKVADEAHRLAEEELLSLDDKRQADSTQTYQQHLLARYRGFNLKREFQELIMGPAANAGNSNPAAGQPY
jgi:hypothetical protein